MKNITRYLLWMVFSLLICDTARAEGGEAKIKILLVTGGHGFEKEPFFDVFKSNPEISFTPATQEKTNAIVYERPDLLTYDVVVLYDMVAEITDKQKAGFESLLKKGAGLVVLHHALVAYQHWPEYEKIIGGRYPEEDGKSGKVTEQVGYQHGVDVPIVVVARDHPITAGIEDFTIKDEIYWGFRTQPDIMPLITTTHPRSGRPLGWYRTEGQSRIVYLQFGHDHTAYENPNYRKLVAQAIHWAAKR